MLTAREMLNWIHEYLGKGALSLDAPVRVQRFTPDDDEIFDDFVATMVSGHVELKELTVYCCAESEVGK